MPWRRLAINVQARQARRKGEMGERGPTGPKGDLGDAGEPAAQIVTFKLDRERYRFSTFLSNGNIGPELNLRELLEYFLSQVCDPSQWTAG